jgi:hypothetical protein
MLTPPLHSAASKGDVDIIRVFIKHGFPRSLEYTAVLAAAASKGNIEAPRGWIQDMKDKPKAYGLERAFLRVARTERVDMIEFFLDHCRKD